MFAAMESAHPLALNAATRREPPTAFAAASEHRLFVITAVVAALLVGVGSGTGLIMARTPGARPVTALVLIHAAVFASWVVMYGVQVALVASGRTAVHRRLGVAGAGLALAMLSLGYAVAIHAARTGYAPVPGADPLSFLVVPLGHLVVFAIYVGAALYWRRTAAIHKRLMWLATTMLLFASVTRLPYVRGHIAAILLVFLAVLLIAPVYERAMYGRVHRVSAWGSTALFLQLLVRRPIGATIWWHTFAAWLIT
jgi:hypothetical protein